MEIIAASITGKISESQRVKCGESVLFVLNKAAN
jgi:hypothetical protein